MNRRTTTPGAPNVATRRGVLKGAAAAGALSVLPRGAARASTEQGGVETAGPDLEQRLDWFLDAKIGMFVHWGPYSVAGVEASWPIMVPGLTALLGEDQLIDEADYVALAKQFNPESFRPREWIAFARRAGMRYLVVTAKHHDGYCLFDAPGTDYKSTKGSSGRDLMMELAEACEAESFPLGFYFSPPDMHDPGYRDSTRPVRDNWTGEPDRAEWSTFLDRMEAQLEALLSNYGAVRVLWFDGLFEHERFEPERVVAAVHRLQPECLLNDRLGAAHADYVTPEQAVPEGVLVRREGPEPEVTATQFRAILEMIASGTDPEAFQRLLEQSMAVRFPSEPLPSPDRFQPWEACMTVGATWAHDPLHRALKSPAELLQIVLDVTSRGGNLLLNLGPGPDGRLPKPECERALVLGEWLERNGEAIYGSTYGRFPGLPDVRSTRSRRPSSTASRDYLVPREANGNVDALRLKGAGTTVAPNVRAYRLEDGMDVEVAREKDAVVLRMPSEPPRGAPHELSRPVFVLEGDPEDSPSRA